VAISEQNVRHLAKLANLYLSDQEIQKMTVELGAIVKHVEQLQAVDTKGVEAIANVAGLVNVSRPDAPAGMLTAKEILANAPQANEVAILVPKVVER
jgi:aspartyl-tRNA(Asn)/glutamyl-tRNA(Gln) amidotransferase subunit C